MLTDAPATWARPALTSCGLRRIRAQTKKHISGTKIRHVAQTCLGILQRICECVSGAPATISYATLCNQRFGHLLLPCSRSVPAQPRRFLSQFGRAQSKFGRPGPDSAKLARPDVAGPDVQSKPRSVEAKLGPKQPEYGRIKHSNDRMHPNIGRHSP